MSDQPDYLQEVASPLRIFMAILTGLFTLLFGLMTVSGMAASISFTVNKEYNLAMGLLVGAMISGLMTAFLFWLTRRLYRGKRTKNEVTIFPVWFVQIVGLILLPPFAYITYIMLRDGAADPTDVGIIIGPPIAMIVLPWLIKRRRAKSANSST